MTCALAASKASALPPLQSAASLATSLPSSGPPLPVAEALAQMQGQSYTEGFTFDGANGSNQTWQTSDDLADLAGFEDSRIEGSGVNEVWHEPSNSKRMRLSVKLERDSRRLTWRATRA
mmetsp:Transcript_151189/g.485687  ORF Transcript_151189/g.485687 Transcript_151189/m.485687 type:complete len:119 (+) Transcript_151189:92-448(+)